MLKAVKFLNIRNRKISIEAKLFAVLCMCLTIISVINGIAIYISGLNLMLNIYVLSGIIVHLLFYYFALRDKITSKIRLGYFVFNILTIIPAYFINAGSKGSTPFFFIFYLIVAILSLDKKHRMNFIVVFFSVTSMCVAFELSYPEWIIPYPNEKARLLAMGTAFFDMAFMTIFMITNYKNVANHDRLLMINSKLRLEASQQELIIAKEKAEEATKIKSKFLTSMSHEIRTPLNGIMGATELLKLTRLDTEQLILLNTVQASNRIMIDIVDDLLNISRIEANKLKKNDQAFEIKKSVADIENVISPFFFNKEIKLIIEISPNVPQYIVADETKYKQILINLVSNAVKFTESGFVKLHIDCRNSAEGKNLISVITDTGYGIKDEDIDKLFLPFSQISNTSTRQFGGVGLGLCISSKFAEVMGGNISVKSEVGEGSEFTLEMPIQLHIDDSFPVNKPSKTIIPIAGMNVLIAEDNIFNQLITSKMLEKSGYKNTVASDGLEALEMAVNKHFDIIIMDMQMPKMDGIRTTIEILNHYKNKNINPPVIIGCSANAMQTDKDQCLNAGMRDFLAKPFTLDDISTMMIKWTKIDEPA